jgi:hypothetical protein
MRVTRRSMAASSIHQYRFFSNTTAQPFRFWGRSPNSRRGRPTLLGVVPTLSQGAVRGLLCDLSEVVVLEVREVVLERRMELPVGIRPSVCSLVTVAQLGLKLPAVLEGVLAEAC